MRINETAPEYELNKIDCHTHTHFSYDCTGRDNTPFSICAAAKEKGLDAIIITDHIELNSEAEGIYEPFDAKRRQFECYKAKDDFKNLVDVYVGCELGQITQYPALAEEYLNKYRFEYVIGSIHNIKDHPDFYYIDFSNFKKEDYTSLWKLYLDEYYEMTKFGYIDDFAHLTYPLRYFAKYGFRLDLTEWEDDICRILESIIKSGAALEVNTAGLRKGLGETHPNEYVIRLYKELGGRKLRLGSDAHKNEHVGADLDRGYEMIKNIYGKEELI